MGFIYKIQNKINQKIYVGQTTGKYLSTRWCQHKLDMLKSDKPLYRSMRKYGLDNFEILILAENVGLEDLDKYEKFWISELNSLVPNGYNISTGGCVLRGSDNPMFGKPAWNRNRRHTPEAIAKMKNSFTPEKLEKTRNRMLGDKNPMFGKFGDKNPMFGKSLSHDHIQSMKNNQPNKKSVRLIELDITFISLGDAAKYIRETTKYTKADYATIRKSIKNNWKCYGYTFEFI